MSKPLEVLYNPWLRGQPGTRTSQETNQWAGRTTLNSGSTSVTVSTTLVKSDAVIQLVEQPSSIANVVASHSRIVVNSIVHGVSFAIARAPSVAAPWDATAMWLIWRTTPDAH